MGSYNYYKVLGCFNRKFKISETGPPPDVRDAFSLYAEKGTHMTADQLARFLVEYQGENGCTINDAQQIIQQVFNRRHHLTKYTRHASSLELEDFFYYLFQDDLNGPIISQVHHDMNAPLQHYFIYTGHNSYLTGNQLSSDCSEIPIIRALERGVRGIELDLWPNSAKDNVHVLHGRTLTTPVTLLTCLKSIRDHAFIKSPYPVIITLEDHLTPDLQAKVAEMVIQVFGEMLYYPQSECLEEFPSPEELKHRIILSTKPPKEYLESKHQRDRESVSPVKRDSVERDILIKETSEVTTEGHEADDRSQTDQYDEDGDTSNYQSSQQGAPQYKRLTAIHAGKAKCDLEHALIAEELKHQTVLATKPPREDLDLKHPRDKENASPVRKDSVEKNFLVKETSETTVEEHEADERTVMDQDNKDSDPSNHPSSQLGAPQYKRMVAMHAGKANHDLKHVQIPEELKNGTPLSPMPAKEYVESKYQRDRESASPVRKDSVEKDLMVKITSEIRAKHEAHERSDTDQDDLGRDPSNCQSSQQGAPQYKRMVAMHAGKAEGRLRHSPTPQEIKHHSDRGSASSVRKDLVLEDFLIKENSNIIEEEHETDERSDTDQDDEDNDTSNNQSSQLGAPQYKRLIAIHAGKAKYGVKRALTDKIVKFNRLSLDEQALEKAATSYGKDLVRFTQRNILRVFPKGTRVTSSNFKPMTGWMHGAQMVAFNMQGYGKSLWIMHGMFRSNGGCGYVKKPVFLMERGPRNEVFDPKVTSPVKKTLRVRVYLGDGWRMDFSHTHFDTFSPPDFYTKLYIIGVPADAAKRKTRIIEDDWGPIWGEEFKFPLTVPELALLRIEVREHDMSDKDDFGGQTCLPVSELRPGIRAVPLYDKKGEKLKSVRLLMQFQFI
ncbi:PREDICTED: phosphoinositide phospholipase C 6-like isoform X2 [Nicotiana attenuata]|uniref:phosphoinositide phospholipase C 6-like isoform X2 n=1 Tax=Nicotiana attenuata TaxID=49451 RepID=UPI0009048054|nr:PREDICTED: phosphoinositide phospholipase C 6-like isoform X2 [Nicotiana attenuata]